MSGQKEYIDHLEKLGKSLGFKIESSEKQKYGCGHYHPDLVWLRNGRKVGFEVEYSKKNGPSNKKTIGDAFFSIRILILGSFKSISLLFIQNT